MPIDNPFDVHVIVDRIILPLLFCPVKVFVLLKIFSNLYQCKNGISFSNRHNWIMKPSATNKVYALLIALFVVLSEILCFVLYLVYITHSMPSVSFLTLSFVDFLAGFPGTFASKYLYPLYLLSTLQYHMNHEPLIKNVISNTNIILIKILLLFLGIKDIIQHIIFYGFVKSPIWNGIPWISLISNIDTFVQIFVEINLTLLYVKGFNNVAHFWYSKYWQEYEEYGGETSKTHEIFIIITRSTVMVITNTLIVLLTQIIAFVGIIYYILQPHMTIIMAETIIFLVNILVEVWCVTTIMTVYFIYDFGYNDYRKICNKCHLKMYDCAAKRHLKQVRNGAFDGDKYTINKNSDSKIKCTWFDCLFKCPTLISQKEIKHELTDEHECLFDKVISLEMHHQLETD